MGGPGLSGEPEREARLSALLASERQAGLPPTFLNTLPQGILDDTLAAELEQRGGFVGCRLRCFGTLARAMDEARRLTTEAEAQGRDAYSGTVVVARELTEGRGRMGRTWFSPPGGLYLALMLSPELVGERMGLYPLAAGVAAATALREYVPQARLKWVNDVLAGGRKMCGLLAESFFSARHREPYLLLGVGANANITAFPADLDGLATSLELELGRPVDLDQLCARLLRHLGLWLGLLHHHDQRLREEEFADQPPPNPVVAAFRALSDPFGRRVLYRSGDGDPGTEAKAMDVVEDGGLILQLDGGGEAHGVWGGDYLSGLKGSVSVASAARDIVRRALALPTAESETVRASIPQHERNAKPLRYGRFTLSSQPFAPRYRRANTPPGRAQKIASLSLQI